MQPVKLGDADRQRLLAEVRALRGASLQKIWLPSPQLCVLQLRVPGRSALVVLDARLSMAAIAPHRPTAPDAAPRSQATLRNALTGTLTDARLEIAAEGARTPNVRLAFDSGRSLIAEGSALLLVGAEGRVLWASSGAERRPGSTYPEARELPLSAGAPLEGRDALVAAAMGAEEAKGIAARKAELLARAKARVTKLRRTLAAVEADTARAAQAGQDRARAELLLPHQSRISRGAREARLPDWGQAETGAPVEVVVPLDPALSAAENAARWLKRAKRYQAAAGRIAARRAEVAGELLRAEELLARIAAAAEPGQLAGAEREFGPKAEARIGARATAPRVAYRTFRSGGTPILVGRSARDNDALTLKVARGNDLWLHARGVQGSHVVVPGAGESPDAQVLGDAALLAAHFSSARGAHGAEVSWTRCKYVRKVKGTPPGAVTYSQERTLRVRLDDRRLHQLLESES